MQPVKNRLWCHLTILDPYGGKNGKYFGSEIRKGPALVVETYTELVKHVANIGYNNRHLNLFFRGQHIDYTEPNGEVSLYPSIYRSISESKRSDKILKKRFEDLEIAVNLLQKNKSLLDYSVLKRHDILAWAVLQHYEVCPTPLLDLTHSLRVASSFALNNNANEYGFVYVLGLPYLNGSISYSVEEEMFNIKLLSICPPTALRPYFQDGYLVGDFPTVYENGNKLNFSRRLIAKFKIKKSTFWNKEFTNIPNRALYPPEDRLEEICERIKDQMGISRLNSFKVV